MKEVVLVDIKLNLDCIYSIGQSNKTILLKNILEKNNVTTFQYIESSLPNVIDIVDEILSFTEENIIFRVTDMNYKLVCKLIELLKEECDDANIILFGDVEGEIEGIKILNENQDYITGILENLEIDNYDLSNMDIYEFDNVDGIKECENFLVDLTDYNSEVIDLEIIKKNIEHILNKNEDLKIFFKSKELINIGQENLKKIINITQENNGQYGIMVEAINDLNQLEEFNYSSIIFRTKMLEDIYSEEVSNKVKDNCEVAIIVSDYDANKHNSMIEELMMKVSATRIRVFVSNEEKNFSCVYVNSITGIKNMAIENGLMMWYQGTYPPTALNNTVKHIYLSEHIEESKLKELDKIASVNHAIISNSNDKNSGISYSKHEHVIKKGVKSNIQIGLDKGSFGKRYIEVQYKEVRNISDFSGNNYMLKILDDEDLEVFRNDIEIFNKVGKLPIYMVNGILKNSCRFLPKGRCQVNSIPRIDIDGQGKISSCDSEYKIGELGDDYFDLMNNIYKKSSEETINRNCSECSAIDKCGACKMLPGVVSREKYCSLMMEVDNIDKFIISSLVIKMLMDSSKYFSDIDVEEIRIINRNVNNLFNKSVKKDSNSIVKESVVMIKVRDEVMLFDLITNNVIAISSLVSYTLEGYMKGYHLEEIKQISKSEFEDNNDIEKCIEEATAQLEYSEIIERIA